MLIKKYNYLPEGAIQLRTDVFVKEQGFTEEFDSIDDIAVHLLLFEDEIPVATCRYYWNKEKASYAVGRIAVAKAYRGKELGAKLLHEAEKLITEDGGQEIYLAAQTRAAGFYEKQGYLAKGNPFYEEYCLHTNMYKTLHH
ncbi:GNAT family N-acetyltransferase [Konateibacter massiliensis]|uniref:GNAT family N-acetyltransferase n=1 Tax=Konateibacter massiliensis TaxID=2002841 RepID=UPI000C15DC1D|nr:GNAT family N-acetyltransferase [Konateibacter massiliensis]